MMHRILWFIFFVVSYSNSVAQSVVASGRSSDTLSYIVTSSEEFVSSIINGVRIDTLRRSVMLSQDSVLMSCESAIVIDQIDALAYDDVIIVHQDSTLIYADSLDYNGRTKDALLRGEVILVDAKQQLYTYRLDYNTDSRKAFYTEGATMLLEGGKLVSREGEYDGRLKTAIFRENVRFEDSTQVVLADSMKYHFNEERLDFLSPVNIFRGDSTEIYSEQGVYSKRLNRTILSQNVQVKLGSKIITCGLAEIDGDSSLYKLYFRPFIIDDDGSITRADSIIYKESTGDIELRGNAYYLKANKEELVANNIYYNEKTEEYNTDGSAILKNGAQTIRAKSFSKTTTGAKGSGDVMIIDTSSKSVIWGDESLQIDSTNSSLVYNLDGSKANMLYELEGDSLYLLGGILKNTKYKEMDTLEYSEMEATDGMKLIWKNIAGLAEYMNYGSKDSIIYLIHNPVLWSDSTQLTADTIAIYIKDNSIDRVELRENAIISIMDSSTIFNQIKGRKIINEMRSGTLISSQVEGNAELFYFVKSKGSYVGVNSSKANSMIFTFVDGSVSQVKKLGTHESSFEEYDGTKDYSSSYLSGFTWQWDKRPTLIEFVKRER